MRRLRALRHSAASVGPYQAKFSSIREMRTTVFLWCSPGRVEIDGVADGGESILRVLVRGEFTGEITLLSGRRSLVRCRAQESSEVLEIGRQNLRRIMQTDAELGETFLRAFLLRRVFDCAFRWRGGTSDNQQGGGHDRARTAG